MVWLKAPAAAMYCGGIHPKLLYAAVKRGELQAARIGAGRNLLFSESWLDAWLLARTGASGPESLSGNKGGRIVDGGKDNGAAVHDRGVGDRRGSGAA